MSKAFTLVVLLGLLAAAAAADFAAQPPHFGHKPVHEPMPPADAPRPRWPFGEHRLPHEHEHGPGPRPGPFAHPPRMAGAPDHMPHHQHHHHHDHRFPGGAQPPMMGHGHGFHGKTMPPAHAPHMHPRHHMPPHEPLAPAY